MAEDLQPMRVIERTSRQNPHISPQLDRVEGNFPPNLLRQKPNPAGLKGNPCTASRDTQRQCRVPQFSTAGSKSQLTLTPGHSPTRIVGQRTSGIDHG
jgi:hypothetical protein